MNTKLSILTALVATSGLVACQKAANEVQKIETRAKLLGSYYSECAPSEDKVLTAGSVRTKYAFAGTEVSKTVQLFIGSGCQEKIGELKYTGGLDVQNPTGPEDSNIVNFSYKKVTVKFDNQKAVDSVNSVLVASCGINDFQVNQEREITSQTKDSWTCPVPQPRPVYDIAKIVEGKLQLGEGVDAKKTSEQSRPTKLDKVNQYSKE